MLNRDVLIVVVVLLAVTGHLCKDLCAYPEELNTVDIDMDELADRRLNMVYVYEKYQDVAATEHMHIDFFKSCDSHYTGLLSLYRDLLGFSLVKRVNMTVDDKGVMDFVMHSKYNPSISNFKWYVLAKTDDGAMLVYRCEVGIVNRIDKRYIMVPSSSPFYSDRIVRRVNSNQIISKDSLNRLLDVDRTYNFNERLVRIPYVLQESYNNE